MFKAVRIGVYSAILLCLTVVEFSAKSNSPAVADRVSSVHTLSGDIRYHKNFYSRLLANSRELIVYLPPGYEKNKSARYPVLYMQDGQNLFDAATSFFAGNERRMDEEAQDLIARGKITPLIIVGIYSVPTDRINEFTPTRDANTNKGGEADLYGRMVVEELKPFVDANYRTLPDRSHTALGGSSLGGLVTMYLGLQYPNVFGKLAITSPAAYWGDEEIVREVKALRATTNQRICLSVGSGEPPVFLNRTRNLRQALIDRGWKDGITLGYMEAPGAQHAPDPLSHRTTHLLTFLFSAN